MADLVRRQEGGSPQPYRQNADVTVFVEKDEIDVRRLLLILTKHKWQIVVVILAIVVPVALYSFLSTPLYQSLVRIQIDPESAKVLPYKEVSDSPVTDFEIYLKTQYEVLRSPSLASRVLQRLGLKEDFFPESPLSALVERVPQLESLRAKIFGSRHGSDQRTSTQLERAFLELVEVRPIRSSRLVEISFVHPDPKMAALVVNTLAEEFIKQHFETKYETTEKASEFLQHQLRILKVKVEKAEEELVRYASQHDILNLDEKEKNVIRQRLEDLNEQLTKVEAQLFARKARFRALQAASSSEFPEGLKTPVIEKLENRLFELEQQLANLRARFDENWPQVIQTKQEIAQVQEQLKREKEATVAQAVRQARLEFEGVQAEFEMLSSAMDRQKNLANRLNEASIQYNILKRDVDTNKQLYQGLLQRLKETGVTAGLEFGNIHVVDHGRVESQPYRPRKLLNLTLALILGLTLGIGLAFFREYLDDTVKTPEELEQALGLPSLGVIPRFEDLAAKRRAPSSRQLKGLTTLSLEKVPESRRSKTADRLSKSQRRLWESYRNLRTSILLSNPDKPPRTILVTSAIPKEGKTTTVAHMGVVLAQTGARTLLIDLDMRKPALGAQFGMNGTRPGMSVFLSGISDVLSDVQETGIPDLFIIPAGPKPPNPAELIGSQRMKLILDQLAEQFAYILIDSPPVLTVTDAQVLAPRVDGVVLVAKAGETPREVIKRATTHLRRVGGKILGVSINQANFESPEYTYYESYYYDDSYFHDTQYRGSAGTG